VCLVLFNGCDSAPPPPAVRLPDPPAAALAGMRKLERASSTGQDPFVAVKTDETSRDADVELSAVKQDEIWDAEHITFEIEKCFGPRFWAGIRAESESAIAALTLTDFMGAVAVEQQTDGTLELGAVGFKRFKSPEHRDNLNAANFSRTLRELILPVSSHKSTKFRVLSISHLAELPTEGDVSKSSNHDQSPGSNSIQTNRWKCRIYVASDGAGEGNELVHMSSELDVVFQFMNESELKVSPVLQSWDVLDFSVESCRQPLFKEVTAEVGLQNTGIADNWDLPKHRVKQYRFQLAVDDFDRDGWPDIAVAESHLSRLFRWSPEASKFLQVTELFGIAPLHIAKGSPVSLAGFFDFDNDGDSDLMLGNRLYQNEEGASFTDITAASGLRFQRQAMGVHFADYNCDGLIDIYVLYQSSRESGESKGRAGWINDDQDGEDNQLWKNLGAGRFRNVTAGSNAGGGHRNTLAATWFFHDDDHFPDLYIANDFAQNSLLRNRQNGMFEDIAAQTHTGDFATSMGVVAGDVDNDGLSDLYVANMFSKMGRRIIEHVCDTDYPPGIFTQIQGSCAGNRLYRRTSSSAEYGEFGESLGVHDVGWAYAPALADFDNDGLLDIYACTGFLSYERNEPDG